MPAVKLTETYVKNRKAESDNREEIPDSLLPGLYLIVQPSGAKSWAVRYRCNGVSGKCTLGKYPVLKLSDAREQARDALVMAGGGKDPSEHKKAERKKAKEAPSDAVEDVVEDFIKRYVEKQTRPRSAEETKRALRKRVVPAWRGRSIGDITRRDIIDLLEDIAATSPANANRTKATISSLYNWCLDREILDTSPATRLKAPAPIVERERVLSDDEIKTLWPAFKKQGEPFSAYFKILLLTGQRRTEVATMKWEHLDLEHGLWTIPAGLTKADRDHEVPLSPLAMEIISDVAKLGKHVFTTRADRPISGFSKTKKAVDVAAKGMKQPWRLHDLRRTCGTGMARLKVQRIVISQVLNHAEGGVTRIYDRYSYLDEKRHALDAWSRHVETLVRSQPNNVVEIRGSV